MFGNYITIPHLLIFIPLVTGLLAFFVKQEKLVKGWALCSSLVTLLVAIAGICYSKNEALSGYAYSYEWMKYMGASFAVILDGTGRLLTLLTAIAFPVIFIATGRYSYKSAPAYFGLMLLAQAGLMGVFVAADALLFYFFWELALIPVYFLCSRWGGEKRIQATFKFFVYTFAGSLLMLVGIIYVYLHTAATPSADHSFSLYSFYTATLSVKEQNALFWLFFIAFAIKMPVFPFHTWQPLAYEQSPTSVTMVLSGVMVKMGLFAVIRWLLPVFPEAAARFDNIVIGLSVVGIVYASLIAIRQDDLKRLVAYSSIAHIGLMCAALFTAKEVAAAGVMIQMFNHGINIIGLWIAIDLLEKQFAVRQISQLGGVAHKAPVLTILVVIIAFANIALPLTNAFVGEFMMFAGLFSFNIWYTVVAGISIILAAVYTLNMLQKVFYGETNTLTAATTEIALSEKLALAAIVVMIFVLGIYPQPLLDLTKESVSLLLTRFK
ncbi:MAG TPA: NADH-quinone oxidoreductase subunit M [Ferruginibacter sp.]|nr:NADH-quinone oxidoreductase subunit M [Ferruginibacter sp.]HMP21307.1 NADH-quinone oxidoreductase subunit M [Ferruginibacter sp.]